MKVAKQLGLRIPEDIMFVGFENSRSAWICEPELTTVDQFGFELGKKATEILINRIKTDSFNYTPERHTIKTKLIVRGSS